MPLPSSGLYHLIPNSCNFKSYFPKLKAGPVQIIPCPKTFSGSSVPTGWIPKSLSHHSRPLTICPLPTIFVLPPSTCLHGHMPWTHRHPWQPSLLPESLWELSIQFLKYLPRLLYQQSPVILSDLTCHHPKPPQAGLANSSLGSSSDQSCSYST